MRCIRLMPSCGRSSGCVAGVEDAAVECALAVGEVVPACLRAVVGVLSAPRPPLQVFVELRVRAPVMRGRGTCVAASAIARACCRPCGSGLWSLPRQLCGKRYVHAMQDRTTLSAST